MLTQRESIRKAKSIHRGFRETFLTGCTAIVAADATQVLHVTPHTSKGGWSYSLNSNSVLKNIIF